MKVFALFSISMMLLHGTAIAANFTHTCKADVTIYERNLNWVRGTLGRTTCNGYEGRHVTVMFQPPYTSTANLEALTLEITQLSEESPNGQMVSQDGWAVYSMRERGNLTAKKDLPSIVVNVAPK